MLTTRLTALAKIVWCNVESTENYVLHVLQPSYIHSAYIFRCTTYTNGVHWWKQIYTFKSIPACIIKVWMFSVTSTKCIQKWFSHSLTNVYVQGKELRNKVFLRQNIFNQKNVPFLLSNSRSKKMIGRTAQTSFSCTRLKCWILNSVTRYFFNATSGECERFLYGGCRGNENRFEDHTGGDSHHYLPKN